MSGDFELYGDLTDREKDKELKKTKENCICKKSSRNEKA